MQATSVRLYRTLVPGLTNATNRLRYYSFYCWVIQHYEKTEHSEVENKWRIFIRRAEALYALACRVADAQQSDGLTSDGLASDGLKSDGLAGGRWAGKYSQSLPTGTIDLRPYTDKPNQSGQYLKALRGYFGQFYMSSMTEVGLLDPSKRIPIISKPLGQNMADAFAKSVGKAVDHMASAIESGTVSQKHLVEIGRSAHPASIPVDSQEMKLLRRYLLAKDDPNENGGARRDSAWLVLDLLRRGIAADDRNYEYVLREAFYNRRLPDGSSYSVSGDIVELWKAYQANELCHIACEAILNALLAELETSPLGIDPNELLPKLFGPVLASIDASDRSWQDWAAETGKAYLGSEEKLAEPILASLSKVESASTSDSLLEAIQLLATLWHRWGGDDASVQEQVQRHAGDRGRSLSGVIRTLNKEANNKVEDALRQTVRRHVISDHLAIAGMKLAASGTFTYRFTLSDGVMSDGRITEYRYTNPRLVNLTRFLRDAHLYDGSAVTQDGMEFLNENKPV